MSLLAAASCPLVEHYQLTSKPGATRFRAAVQLTRWEPNLELARDGGREKAGLVYV